MKLRNDWTPAYLLYYLSAFIKTLILLLIILKSIQVGLMFGMNSHSIEDIPVHLKLEDFDAYKDVEIENIQIKIPSRTTAIVDIKLDSNSQIGTILFYNGFLLYKGVLFFSLLFFGTKFFKNIAEKNPFASQNANYLFIISGILFAFSFLNFCFSKIPVPFLNDSVFPDNLTFLSLVFPDNYLIIGGLTSLVFGYVFKEASRIYEEQKLTV